MKKLQMMLLACCLFLTGCSSEESDTYKLGLNYELSGPVASYGIAISNGIQQAIGEINADGGVNGKQIEMILTDNKSDAAEATTVATKLATVDNVVALLGPATSGATKATVPVSSENQIPLISASATADDTFTLADGSVAEYAYRTCFNDSFQGLIVANYASNNLNADKVVVISDSSSDYAKGLSKVFNDQFSSNGGEVIAEESYVAGDTDFTAVMTKIKDMDFDAIFIPGYYDEAGLIIKQAREAGIDVPILGCDGFESDVLAELAGDENLNDVYYTNHYSTLNPSAEMSSFISNYEEIYGESPNAFSALGYDLGLFICDAIERSGDGSREAINEAIANTENFTGITGSFSMGENHSPVKSIFVIEMQNGVAVGSEEIKPN